MAIDLGNPSGNARTRLDENSHHIQAVDTMSTGPQKKIGCVWLNQTGSGGDGQSQMNVNGSVTPVTFYYKPAAGTVFRVARLIMSMQDTSGFSAGEYGNLGSALSTGCDLKHVDDTGTITDFTGNYGIYTNADWGFYCYDVDLKTWGVGDEFLMARMTFTKMGQYIRLDGDDANNGLIEFVVNDDLTGLTDHRILLQGYFE